MKKYVLQETWFIFDDCFYNAERSSPIKIFNTRAAAEKEKKIKTIEKLKEIAPKDLKFYRNWECGNMFYAEDLQGILESSAYQESTERVDRYLSKMEDNDEDFYTVVEVESD